MPSPTIFVFAPVPFVGLFVPFVSVVPFPPRRRLTTPFPPLRRGHPVVADRDLENRGRHVDRCDDRPRTIPAPSDVPSPPLHPPVLMAVEEAVRGSTRRVGDRHIRVHNECRGG